MSHASLHHRRTHNLLLISKLLNQRDTASPFTIVLDTLEQRAQPLLREYTRRAKLSKTTTVFLSFETFTRPKDVDFFIPCGGVGTTPEKIAKEVTATLGALPSDKRTLVILDSLMALAALAVGPTALNLTGFLSSLLQPPPHEQLQVSMVAVYHHDVPLPTSTLSASYTPTPLSLLSYLATTIITVHSLPILLAERAANARSLAGPAFGLSQAADGVLIGLKPKAFSSQTLRPEERGIVLELEHRRKSGRGVLEWYFLPSQPPTKSTPAASAGLKETISLLDDHPLFRKPKEEAVAEGIEGMTFNLELTERQRLEREGVVLPYFDAQKGDGPGEGGRILYDLGAEDDFDEEEDEI